MLLMIDNYDSFTYNLVQYFGELGEEVKVARNDAIDINGIAALAPARIVISPGPCTPNEAGVSLPLVRAFAGKLPILGVCLGHQAIGQAFGGRIVHAGRVMHGKTSDIRHASKGVFAGLPSPFRATRYHSLAIERASLPDCLEITAETDEGDTEGRVGSTRFGFAYGAGARFDEDFLVGDLHAEHDLDFVVEDGEFILQRDRGASGRQVMDQALGEPSAGLLARIDHALEIRADATRRAQVAFFDLAAAGPTDVKIGKRRRAYLDQRRDEFVDELA